MRANPAEESRDSLFCTLELAQAQRPASKSAKAQISLKPVIIFSISAAFSLSEISFRVSS
jgi:hypothetical protein